MKKASVTETKNRLSQLLDHVRNGETVIVTDRNIPVAQLMPVQARAAGAAEGLVERLERNGLVRRAKTSSLPREIIESTPPQSSRSALNALLTEREEGR